MPFDPNTIFEVRVRYEANGQRCYNIFHLDAGGAVGTGLDERGWQDQLRDYYAGGVATDGSLLKEMRDAMSEDVSIDEVAVQIVYPVRYRASKVTLLAAVGLVAEPLPNQNTALVFTKFGELGNRANIGSWHQGGLGISNFEDGSISAAGLGRMQNIRTAFLDGPSFVIDGVTTSFFPVILNKEPIPDTDPVKFRIKGKTDIVATNVEDTARVMRRRTKGVGK